MYLNLILRCHAALWLPHSLMCICDSGVGSSALERKILDRRSQRSRLQFWCLAWLAEVDALPITKSGKKDIRAIEHLGTQTRSRKADGKFLRTLFAFKPSQNYQTFSNLSSPVLFLGIFDLVNPLSLDCHSNSPTCQRLRKWWSGGFSKMSEGSGRPFPRFEDWIFG